MKVVKRDIDANANKNTPAQVRPLDKDAEPKPGTKKPKTQSSQMGGGDEWVATSPPNQNSGQSFFDISYLKTTKKWDRHPVNLWKTNWYANSCKHVRIQMQAQPLWERLVPHRKSLGMVGNLIEQHVKTMSARGIASMFITNNILIIKSCTHMDFSSKTRVLFCCH